MTISEYDKQILERIWRHELTVSAAIKLLNPNSGRRITSSKKLGSEGVCWYCGNNGPTNKDHFYPRSKGGRLIVMSCFPCNNEKDNKTPLEWADYIQKKIDNGGIEVQKGERMIRATLTLWENTHREDFFTPKFLNTK